MARTQRKLCGMLLSLMVAFSSICCFTGVFNAAAADTMYFQAPADWTDVRCYAWNSGGVQNAGWPGQAMQRENGNIYRYTFQDSFEKVIFNNGGDNQTQTPDLDYPGGGMMYVYESRTWVRYTGESVEPGPAPSNELIGDPSFENDNGFWSYGTGMSQTGERTHTGAHSVKSSVRGISGVALFTSGAIAVTPHTDYRLSGYIYRGDGSSWAYLDMNDIQGELQVRAQSFGKWQYVTGVWNSGDNTSVQVRGVVERDYHQTSPEYQGIMSDVWFDDISFCKVEHPSYSEEIPEIPVSSPSWTLSNKDVRMTVTVGLGKEYITEFKNLNNGVDWIDGAAQSPLLARASGRDVAWTFKDAQIDDSDGKTVTLRYQSTDPALTLHSVWEIKSEGPVYHFSTLFNHTGAAVTVDSGDVVAADLLFKLPGDVTAYRFNRSRFNNGLDAQFTTGVRKQQVTKNMYQRSPVENSWETNTGVLPFLMLQSGGHGLYFGYEWSYGEILARTQSDENKLRLSAALGEVKEEITRDSGEAFTIPGVFYGAYSGDTDDGSNQMKRWFWDNQMTPTLRENKNEPPIEMHVPGYSEGELTNFLHKFDVASWGVDLLKMDYWWTVPTTAGDANSGFDSVKEQQWLPDPGKWPNGMTYGTITKKLYPRLLNSLYMCDTYQGVDIGTKEGREKQIAALSQRIEDWKIDYWRSDFDVEAPNSYASHEGLLSILDTLSGKYGNFRYECCSAGGALKDFSTLKRMTFMTMEDSGGALNHRMAFYANSYMVNPLQLKFDLGFDWTSPEDAPYIAQNPEGWAYYVLRTAMMGSMMAGSVGREMTQTEIAAAKECFALYNTRQREILRGTDVYHILPMPDGINWDGMQFYNKDIERGSVFLFKNRESGGAEKTIYLDGLQEKAVYTLSFEERPALNCTKTGKELMENGVNVIGMDRVYDSEIIWIEKTGGKEPVYKLGDVDGSGTVDIADVLMVQKHLAKFLTLTDIQKNAADVTKDGNVTIDDVVRIQKKIALIIDEF